MHRSIFNELFGLPCFMRVIAIRIQEETFVLHHQQDDD